MPIYFTGQFNGGTITNPLVITQGTIVADAPQIDGTVTWNNAGIAGPAWKLNVTNTSSAAVALLADFQVGSASKASISKTGSFGTIGAYLLARDGAFTFTNSNSDPQSTTVTVQLVSDLGTGLAVRNSTTAMHTRIYNTYTSSTNYERCTIDWQTVANQCNFGTEKGSGGGTARALGIQTDATVRLLVGASGGFTVTDANDFALGTTTGTKIGTATSQKLGFYNATPIVQGASVADATGGAVIDAEARTAINTLISRIEATGLIATV